MTASLPVIEYAKELKCPQERLYRALPLSTATAIFPAQEDLAPSQIMPEVIARAFTTVWITAS